jgi:6-phosphogluconate dehydrogenase
MQIGMIGLGRMGSNMVRRLLRAGHECVVFDRTSQAVADVVGAGARGAASVRDFVQALATPRAIWMMVPAAAVDDAIAELLPHLGADDTLIDGGNSHYVDDPRRARDVAVLGVHYVDVGTSGGVWGLERGYCLMIGGDAAPVRRLEPIFLALAPGAGDIPPTPGRASVAGTAQFGYLHCGPSGAGHFVKMIHNGIEYGIMAAYAEGFGILAAAGAGDRDGTTGFRGAVPGHRYALNLPDIAELWRRGSVIGSWLLDLTARALNDDPSLAKYEGRVADSGEGRWTVQAAIDAAVPAPVLTSALFARFNSRGEADFQNRLLSALRWAFGGHAESPPGR